MENFGVKDGIGIIPDGITEIPSEAFRNCHDLKSVTIPVYVTKIKHSAFYGCDELTEIKIPDSVTEIGMYCFEGCKSLLKLNIPDSVKKIEAGAFWGCTALNDISLPPNLETIDDNLFRDCISLKEIEIPVGVNLIRNTPFEGCVNLTTLKVAEGNTTFDSRNGCNAIIQTKYNTIYLGIPSTKIPDSIKEIGRNSFAKLKDLSHIDIPNSVEGVGEMAFYECSDLDDINLPSSIKIIYHSAFDFSGLKTFRVPASVVKIEGNILRYCVSLKEISVDGANPVYDSRNNCNAIIHKESSTIIAACNSSFIPDDVENIGQSSFEGCKDLQEINIPASVKTIDGRAFYGCKSLKEIIIPDSVTEIWSEAFERCENIETIVIPKSITKIVRRAFSGCKPTYLTLCCPINITEDMGFNLSEVKILTLGTGIKKFPSNFFDNCNNLEKIYVPAKKTKYYLSRIPASLHHLIQELPPEK